MIQRVKNCIVTGGAGFIGCELSRSLLEHFDRVVAIDVLHPQVHKTQERPSALHNSVELVIADICNGDAWIKVLSSLESVDTIIHLAAETGTGQSLTESARHSMTNVHGTAVMLDALGQKGIVPRQIILASSRAVYGEGAWLAPDEKSIFYPGQRSREQLAAGVWDFDGEVLPMQARSVVPAPVSIYGATKLAQENMLSAWCQAYGTTPTIFRFQNVYGPGQSLINSYTGIVSLFAQLAKRGESIPLYEDGEMLRDFVLVSDVTAAVLKSLHVQVPAGEILDVGNGVGTTIKDVAEIVSDIYGAPPPHVCGKYRFGDVRHAFADIDLTSRILKWKPAHTLDEGLRLLCNWIDGSSK